MSRIDQVTLALAALTVAAALCAVVVFLFPKIPINFLEPTRELPPALPSLTLTPRLYPTLPPEWTLTPSPTTTATQPSATPSITASPTTSLTPAPTDTRAPTPTGPTRTPRPPLPYMSPTTAPTLTPNLTPSATATPLPSP